MIEIDKIYNEDCLVGMQRIPDKSIDCIICDPPYGTTCSSWDKIIPFDKLWAEYKRIRKPYAPILLFGSELFSTLVRMSNLEEFRYDWIWEKEEAADFVHAKNRPLKNFEIISAFCQYPMGHKSQLGDKRMPYNPQGLIRSGRKEKRSASKFGNIIGHRPSHKNEYIVEYENYPKAIQYFGSRHEERLHPTQKPIDLLRYLILTYTNEGDLVLDNCAGSGSTAVACIKEKRHFIGFETNNEYFDKACKRIEKEQSSPTLF